MRVWCIGAGSMGLLLAGRLQAAGGNVWIVPRSANQAEAIRRNGVTVTDSCGTGTRVERIPVPAFAFEEMVEGGSVPEESPDWIVLLVKQSHLTDELVRVLARYGENGTRLLCFQNGLGHAEKLAQVIPADKLFVAVTTEGARRASPVEVAHTGRGTTTVGPAFPECLEAEGRANGPESGQKAQKKLENLLHEAGFEAHLSNNMDTIVWNKLLVNAVINPLTALLRVKNGELPKSEYRLELMRSIYEEARTVASKRGIELGSDGWMRILQVCRDTAANDSSMLQDVLAGRITEVEWINGAIVRLAREFQLDVPVNETVYRLIRGLDDLMKQERG